MLISGRPLLDNAPDVDLFVSREQELARLTIAVEQGLNVLLTGDAGSGKTTLVNMLLYRVRASRAGTSPLAPITLLMVNAEGARTGGELLRAIATAASSRQHLGAKAEFDSSDDALRELAQWSAGGVSEAARHGTDPARALIVVDDVNARAGHDLFGRLRDQLWELDIVWVIVARRSAWGGLLTPPADVFFERRLELERLTPAAIRELIGRRVGQSFETEANEIARASDGNPRHALDSVREYLEARSLAGSSQVALARADGRDRAFASLNRSARMLVSELESLGPSAASDSSLLDRLGWTRARAVQVFAELAAAGLVRSDNVAQAQGRPRKVYRLVSPTEFATDTTGRS